MKFFFSQESVSGNAAYLVTNSSIISEGEKSIGVQQTLLIPMITGFTSKRIIKGNAHVSFVVKSTGGGTTLKIKLQKISGGTTDISSEITTISTGTEKNFFIKLPISSDITLKPDDKLQISIETVASGSYTVFIGTDPNNNASTELTRTKSILFIPFKLQDL